MSNHRELNPQLFGSSTVVEKIGNPVDPLQPASSIMGRSAEMGAGASARSVPYPSIDIKAFEHQLGILKVAMIQMDKRLESLTSKNEDLSRNTHQRLERFTQTLQRMDENQARLHQENTAKFAQLVGRVNESKIQDTKVTELMDRHNQIIRNFENRLLSLQRLVSEQEMALHNAQASLEESRNDIARLKRS